MDKIVIQGGKTLNGSVEVSGAKNAALPILFATLLTPKPCRLSNVPALQDIESTVRLLSSMGVQIEFSRDTGEMTVDASSITSREAPYDLVRKMRASCLVLGPLLARFGEARVSLPGGCAIGTRPINYHLTGFEKLGAEIELSEGYVNARTDGLRGGRVVFEFPSVGATENLMMAAALAKGETVLENCAREPEIVDLADFLRGAGCEIAGDGTETILIQGQSSLGSVDHRVIGDRIEAGTYLAAAMITGGSAEVRGIAPRTLESVLSHLESSGAQIIRGDDFVSIRSGSKIEASDMSTQPFPGFPTDMQAQYMALMCLAQGSSLITENIFENRFMHVPELMRLGADISISGKSALVRGVPKLTGAPLMATDLRASASLIVAGLVAEGQTVVSRIYHLDRGYARIEDKLRRLGAQIERISGD